MQLCRRSWLHLMTHALLVVCKAKAIQFNLYHIHKITHKEKSKTFQTERYTMEIKEVTPGWAANGVTQA